jgi:hypothetical protein
MSILFMILIGIAALLCTIGSIVLLVAAFRTHILWGFATLLIPFAQLVFIFVHWQEAKRGVLIQLCAVPFILISFTIIPKNESVASYFTSYHGVDASFDARHPGDGKKTSATVQTTHPVPTPTPAPTPALEERIAANQQELDRLQAKYEDLKVQRRDLLKSDQAGTHAYNLEVAKYQSDLQTAKARQAELMKLKK